MRTNRPALTAADKPLDLCRPPRHNAPPGAAGLVPIPGGDPMADLTVGKIVVLISGSMKMVVEAVDGDNIQTVWCHEGEIGRDTFPAALLREFEFRDDDARPPRAAGGGKSFKGPREGGGKPYGDKPRSPRGSDERPKAKTGWDGKPREKKFFRKDD